MKKSHSVSSKLLQKKWISKDYEQHQQRLKEIKPFLEIRQPEQFTHLKVKAKKDQMLEGKLDKGHFV